MRVLKFDDELITALRTLGFKVADDNETAEIQTQVTIIRPERGKDFWLEIQLKDYSHFHFNIPRSEIMDLVELVEEEGEKTKD